MDRMSPLDASFLHIENAVSHMHIGSVAIFEGPVPAYEEFEAMIAGNEAALRALAAAIVALAVALVVLRAS